MSDYEDELIDAIPFGAACVGEVGLHVIVSKPVAVGGGDTVFTGITGDDKQRDTGKNSGKKCTDHLPVLFGRGPRSATAWFPPA